MDDIVQQIQALDPTSSEDEIKKELEEFRAQNQGITDEQILAQAKQAVNTPQNPTVSSNVSRETMPPTQTPIAPPVATDNVQDTVKNYLLTNPPQIGQSTTDQFSPEARQAMLERLNRPSGMQMAAMGISGLGDAIARSYGGDKSANAEAGVEDIMKTGRERELAQFESGALHDMNSPAVKTLRKVAQSMVPGMDFEGMDMAQIMAILPTIKPYGIQLLKGITAENVATTKANAGAITANQFRALTNNSPAAENLIKTKGEDANYSYKDISAINQTENTASQKKRADYLQGLIDVRLKALKAQFGELGVWKPATQQAATRLTNIERLQAIFDQVDAAGGTVNKFQRGEIGTAMARVINPVGVVTDEQIKRFVPESLQSRVADIGQWLRNGVVPINFEGFLPYFKDLNDREREVNREIMAQYATKSQEFFNPEENPENPQNNSNQGGNIKSKYDFLK
jgi:hypothetical protein